jgi:hypothetical protein
MDKIEVELMGGSGIRYFSSARIDVYQFAMWSFCLPIYKSTELCCHHGPISTIFLGSGSHNSTIVNA